jgi:hypothetical protein
VDEAARPRWSKTTLKSFRDLVGTWNESLIRLKHRPKIGHKNFDPADRAITFARLSPHLMEDLQQRGAPIKSVGVSRRAHFFEVLGEPREVVEISQHDGQIGRLDAGLDDVFTDGPVFGQSTRRSAYVPLDSFKIYCITYHYNAPAEGREPLQRFGYVHFTQRIDRIEPHRRNGEISLNNF